MKFKVPAHRVLIKLAGIDEALNVKVSEDLKKLGFQVAHESGQEEFVVSATERGTVAQIGPMAWKHPDYGYGTPDWQPWCKVGDTVMYGKYAGKVVKDTDTGDNYMVINDDDIILVIEE